MSAEMENVVYGPDDYSGLFDRFKESLDAALNSPGRFQPISKREDRTNRELTSEAMRDMYRGKYLLLHRGIQILKTSDDLLIYTQMFWHVRPRTIIELGTFAGGSAIWMADNLNSSGIDCHIYSIDIDLSLISKEAKKTKPDNVTFLQGDCNAIDQTLSPQMLTGLPHPVMIIEDAHVNVLNNLRYFHQFLQVGDYLVIEDTNPNTPIYIGADPTDKQMPVPVYDMRKLKELKMFLAEHEEEYAVDSYFNDLFGYNACSQWNSIVRKMK
jgi:cephalosporin hydroxylase